MKLTDMSRLKTLSLLLVSLFTLGATDRVQGQDTYFSVATAKTFRQGPEKSHAFRGGSLNVRFRDGLMTYQAGCQRSAFWPPNVPLDPCQLGATGFVTDTAFDQPPEPNPYFSTLSVVPAFLVHPSVPESVFLSAAPASKLPRPLYGFADGGYAVFYNLLGSDASLRESLISIYNYSRVYEANELTRMNQETVPGSYFFRFPKLNDPTRPVNIASTVRALPDGLAKLNSQFTGFNFDTGLGFDPDGFMRVNFNRPTTFRWSGINSNLVNANVDRLLFSIRYLSDPTDPLSETTTTRIDPVTGVVYINPLTLTTESPASLFPGFATGRDPRILLPNPFVSSFSIPPIFPIAATGVVELELIRNLANSGSIFDTSSRIYQIPIRFSSTYTDYALRSFRSNTRKVGILEDFDGDAVDNLTEWVLNSRAEDFNSKPPNLVPRLYPAVTDPTFFPPLVITPAFWGLKLIGSQGYVPGVVKTLQRSTSAVVPTPEASWVDMVSDASWTVIYTPTSIEMRSTNGALPPAGTTGHKYRLRVSLAP
jgi:hypothetical protein